MPPTHERLPHDQLLARTQAAISTGTYSPPATAVLLTGHTRHNLYKMGEAGDLPTRKSGAQARAFETGPLLREAYRNGRLLLTDLLRTADGHHLDENDLAADLHAHEAGTWYTLSRRGHRPPDWASWQAWYSGDRDQALAHLAEEQRQHRQEADHLASRGLTRRHLWCPTLPLTFYGQYQQTRYMRLAEAGSHVRVVPGHRLTHAETQGTLPDVDVLPDAVYVRRYTTIGHPGGATRMTCPDLAAATRDLVHWLYTTQASLLQHFTCPTSTRVPA